MAGEHNQDILMNLKIEVDGDTSPSAVRPTWHQCLYRRKKKLWAAADGHENSRIPKEPAGITGKHSKANLRIAAGFAQSNSM